MKGIEGWLDHHEGFFKKRWKKIVRAMNKPNTHVLFFNPFAPGSLDPDTLRTMKLSSTGMPGCYYSAADPALILSILNNAEGLRPFYLLDAASVYAAYSLDVRPGMRVLDMCAAPGGKTFVLASCLFASQDREEDDNFIQNIECLNPDDIPPPKFKGLLVSNEFSLPRRQRLQEVVRTHVPEKIAASCIRVTGFDMTHPPPSIRVMGPFDRILLDAPCTSDRHQLQSNESLNDWNIKQVQNNAKRQTELLSIAQSLLAPGGKIIYSTCALSNLENDGVIESILTAQKKNKKDVTTIFGAIPPLKKMEPAKPPSYPPFSSAVYNYIRQVLRVQINDLDNCELSNEDGAALNNKQKVDHEKEEKEDLVMAIKAAEEQLKFLSIAMEKPDISQLLSTPLDVEYIKNSRHATPNRVNDDATSPTHADQRANDKNEEDDLISVAGQEEEKSKDEDEEIIGIWEGCVETQFGLLLVPDVSNLGPLFIARLDSEKVEGHIKIKMA